MNKKYIVTGGAGFIGSNIAKELVQQGVTVKVIDNYLTGHKKNLLTIKDDLEIVEGDIRDTELLTKEFAGFDFVLHQAALASVPRSIDNPVVANDHNINGTLSVLVAARDAKVRRVVCASSSSVYGDNDAVSKSEDLPVNPLSPYALGKYTAEQYARLFSQLYGLETVALRYFNVFGPNQDPNSEYAAVIPKFITAMLKNEIPTIYGDGEQSRDFTYVTNNVAANLAACASTKANGEVLNIAAGNSTSLNELVDMLNQILKTNLKPRYEEARPGDVMHSQADISKAKSLMNYEVIENFASGLQKTVEWYRQSA